MLLDAVSTVKVYASNNPNGDPTAISAADWFDITPLFGDVDFVGDNFTLDFSTLRFWWYKFEVIVSNGTNSSYGRIMENN